MLALLSERRLNERSEYSTGLFDGACYHEKAEDDEERPKEAYHRIRACAWKILRAHDGALAPDLKAHHYLWPHGIQPAEDEQNEPNDSLFHFLIILESQTL